MTSSRCGRAARRSDMARVSKVDPCLICDQVPCECNKPEPKAAKPRLPKAKPVVNVEDSRTTTPAPARPSKPVRPSVVAAMKERAAATPPPPTAAPMGGQPADAATPGLKAALKALWPLLHPDEKVRYPWAEPDLNDRRDAWKARVKR